MRGWVLTVSGLAVGLAIGAAASDFDWGFAVRARPAAPAGATTQWVDRTHKGSRLDQTVTRVGKEPTPPAAVMEGCEAAASPLSASAQIPARCAA
ncbi:MAG: hypothetical protein ACTHLO_10395 [Pseudolabrys sp.]